MTVMIGIIIARGARRRRDAREREAKGEPPGGA